MRLGKGGACLLKGPFGSAYRLQNDVAAIGTWAGQSIACIHYAKRQGADQHNACILIDGKS